MIPTSFSVVIFYYRVSYQQFIWGDFEKLKEKMMITSSWFASYISKLFTFAYRFSSCRGL